MTTWPCAQDYQLAIQDCRSSFIDHELRSGEAVTHGRFGLPKCWSGSFAVVFCVRCHRSPPVRYAVRCFVRQVRDQEFRYAKVAAHFSQYQLPCMVHFEYQHRGILVNGEWYPIVKMRWVDGVPLDQAIHQAIKRNNFRLLEKLASTFIGVIENLDRAQIGHGDLQHGNILVSKKKRLILVDYDGIYIHELASYPPNEVGHPNYQHPRRIRSGYYGSNVDSFSALVIYLSLLALQHDPSLWGELHDLANDEVQDDFLLFRGEDYRNPGQTPVWQRLLHCDNDKVRCLAERLMECCNLEPAQLPSPSEIIRPVLITTVTSPGVPDTPWVEDYFAGGVAEATWASQTGTQPLQGPGTWVSDYNNNQLPSQTAPKVSTPPPSNPARTSAPRSKARTSKSQGSKGKKKATPVPITLPSNPVHTPAPVGQPSNPSNQNATANEESIWVYVALIIFFLLLLLRRLSN